MSEQERTDRQMDETTLEIYQEFAQNSQEYYDQFTDIGILILISGIVLLPLISEFVRSYTYINEYQIPLGNIVSLLAIPLLIWIIRRQRKIFPSMER